MSSEEAPPITGDGPNLAGLLLGSNIDPASHLPAAVHLLARLGRIEAVSRVWQSAPVGDENQADYCNAAVLLRTSHPQDELRTRLRDIEHQLGRIRDPHNKNAPRTIDIDIALWLPAARPSAAQCIDADVTQRVFAAACLAEVLPQFPLGSETLEDIARRLHDRDAARLRLSVRTDLTLPRHG